VEAFGRFTLLKRLGAGGMGEVFLAQTQPDQPPVVLKRVLPHLTENPRFLKLFLDETRIAARLNHPNIARIFELGETQGTWFIAMEHVPGLDLREALRRARDQESAVPVNVAIKIALDVALGLEHAHTAVDSQGRGLSIVHRDVSPHNVLVSRAGEIKLIDFGVAKATNKSVHTAAGILKGKFPYMAPEQARGEPVDARTDLFALGIVLWETLAGRYLFRGKTDAATLKMVRTGEVTSLLSLRKDVPFALDTIVLKTLAKDPADRFQSARALHEALAALQADFPPADIAKWLGELEDLPGEDDGPGMFGDEADSEELDVVVSNQDHTERGPNATTSDRAGAADADAEPMTVLADLVGQPTNIVPQTTSFIGRVAELADLHQLFQHEARLITLLGPGGTGKTRLALQLGEQLISHFNAPLERGRRRGGVWFCELDEATNLDGITASVARALSVQLAPGDAVTQLGHAFAARGELLIILDNFEQIVAHAGETLGLWLRAAPLAKFVVSSREVLRVPGETIFEVPPLRVPKPGEPIRGAEAVELFVERARAVRAKWEPTAGEETSIAEIVKQLDGLPLAIELAAARMSLLTPAQVVQRLPRRFELLIDKRGGSERQATMRGAIDWSWNMLSEAEASTLAQLSVFRGGFGSDALASVINLAHVPEAPRPLDVLMTLRAKSLVRAYFPNGDDGLTRFGLYESLREYAKEKLLGRAEQEPTLERHAKYYLALGARLSQNADSSVERLNALDVERENLFAVFNRAVDRREPGERLLQIVLALDPLLSLRGPFTSHLQMIDVALSSAGSDPRRRALALEARARARQARGRSAEALTDLLQVIEFAREANDQGLEGRALAYLGLVERVQGQRAEARQRLNQALVLLRGVGDQLMEGRTLSFLAFLLHDLGLEAEAIDVSNQAFKVHRTVGDRRYQGITLANLGVQQQSLGLLEQAKANYLAALSIHRELGNRRSEGISHINLGDLQRDVKRPRQAMTHYERALIIVREVGARRTEGIALYSIASLQHELLELATAMQTYNQAIDVLVEVRAQRYEGLARAGLAATLALSGKVARADEVLLEATRVLTEVGDASSLDALDVYRGQVELGEALVAQSPTHVASLKAKVQRRIAHAERAQGTPSPSARSDAVRTALRGLKAAMKRLKAEP